MAHNDRDSSTLRPWARRIIWALLSLAAPLFAAAAFLVFEAARGVAHGFSFELVLSAAFGCVLPLAVVAAVRRWSAWSGPASVLFTFAATAIGVAFLFLAAVAASLA